MNYESSFFTGYPTTSYHSSHLFTDDYLGSSSYYPATSATNTSTRLLSDEILRRDFTRTNIDRTPMLKANAAAVREYSDSLETHSTKTRPIDSTASVPVPRNPEKSSVNVHTWLTEEAKTTDRQTSQTEDDEDERRDEPSHVLPSISSKTGGDHSPRKHKEDPAHEKAFQMRHDSYFDSLFQGQIARRQSEQGAAAAAQTNSRKINPSSKAPISSRTEKAAGPPTMVTKKIAARPPPPKESVTPRPIQPHSTAKNADERYREALQKFRADRLEQQQREMFQNESTAKRMSYGKYVRGATKESLLVKAKKPLPWSDFVDMRKGNVYSLSKQEKRDLFYLSKSYGERIRQRNFAMNYGAQTARIDYPILPYPPKPSSNPETTRPIPFDEETKLLPLDRTFSAHSSTAVESDETDSTAHQNRLFGAKFDSSQVTTTATTTTTTESERESSSDRRETIAKKRENLSTVQEEKSNENSRTKKH